MFSTFLVIRSALFCLVGTHLGVGDPALITGCFAHSKLTSAHTHCKEWPRHFYRLSDFCSALVCSHALAERLVRVEIPIGRFVIARATFLHWRRPFVFGLFWWWHTSVCCCSFKSGKFNSLNVASRCVFQSLKIVIRMSLKFSLNSLTSRSIQQYCVVFKLEKQKTTTSYLWITYSYIHLLFSNNFEIPFGCFDLAP
jgi:hypothetical protein